MPYHCLKVPELLSMIFRLLLLPLSPDATRSSQILRVCRFWFEVAAPILWANSQDFRALARLIAPIVPSDSPDVHGGIKTYKLRNYPTILWNWVRFEQYAQYVRRLDFAWHMSSAYALSATTDSVDLDDESGYAFSDRYDIDTNSIYQYNPILDAMARYVAIYHESRSTKTLFPMLRTLKWAAFSGEPTTDYSVLFMHPDMRNFAFSYDPTGIDYHMPPTRQSLGLYFDLVLERMPSLSYLELNVNSDLLHPVLLKKIVAGLPILETVILPSFTDPELMDSSLEQLALLIYLQKIVFRASRLRRRRFIPGLPDTIDDTFETTTSPDIRHPLSHPFPRLKHLEIQRSGYQAALDVMESMTHPDSNGLSVLRLTSHGAERPGVLAETVIALAKSSPNISEVSLTYEESQIRRLEVTDLDDTEDMVGFPHLEPLLASDGHWQLRILEIVAIHPVTFSIADLERLAQALPRLEKLILNNYPTSDPRIRPAFPLLALLPLAKFCPRLTQLGICINATTDVVPPEEGLYEHFPALEFLGVGLSIIEAENMIPTSLFLSQILPLGCEVSAERPGTKDPEICLPGWRGPGYLIGNWAKTWWRVNAILPHLISHYLRIAKVTKMRISKAQEETERRLHEKMQTQMEVELEQHVAHAMSQKKDGSQTVLAPQKEPAKDSQIVLPSPQVTT